MAQRGPAGACLQRETFQVDAVTLALVSELARREGLSRSSVVNRLVRYGLEHQRKLDALAKAAS